MKKIKLTVILLFVTSLLFASYEEDLTPPEFNVSLAPVNLGESWYDYCQGSYVNTNVQVQADEHGGTYIFWHRLPSAEASAKRRVYYTYINASGVASPPTVADNSDDAVNYWEGYPGVDVDQETGMAFFGYHVNNDADAEYEINFGWDNFQLGASGIISPVTDAIDNTQIMADGIEPYADFIWPYVFVIDHPTEDNMKKIIIFGNNSSGDNPSGLTQADNVIVATADLNLGTVNPATSAADLDWDYNTIPGLDAFANAGHRAYITVPTVSEDGKICLFGNVFYADDAPENQGIETLDKWIAYSEDFGENFTFTTTRLANNLIDPVPADFDPDGDRSDFHWDLVNTNHTNSTFAADGSVYATSNVSIMFYTEGEADASYLPAYQFPKYLKVDPIAGTMEFEDIFPKRTDDTNWNGQYVPWDRDEDGEFDTNEDNAVTAPSFWPHWNSNKDKVGSDNMWRITKGMVGGNEVLAAVWTDGTYNYWGSGDDADPDFASWVEVPEIAISISTDGGMEWADPIFMSAHTDEENTSGIPELKRANGDKMIPIYLTPGDRIKDAGNGWGTIGLSFYDDYSYGSFIQDEGANIGGTVYYMEVDVNFGVISNDNINTVNNAILKQNYPNPFNPTTTINYNLANAGNVELAVYNVKGQLVKTLVNDTKTAGDHFVVWNGNDDAGNSVASGVYFYKVNTNNQTETKKMVLMK